MAHASWAAALPHALINGAVFAVTAPAAGDQQLIQVERAKSRGSTLAMGEQHSPRCIPTRTRAEISMSRTLIALLLVLTAGAAWGAGIPEVERVQARLFYNHTGTLSPPITPEFALWNTTIGEGDAGEPSDAILIDVVVRGTPGSYDPARIDLIVRNSATGKVVTERSSEIGVLSPAGEFHAAFWMAGTGCDPLTIEATVHGTESASLVEVPFACGE